MFYEWFGLNDIHSVSSKSVCGHYIIIGNILTYLLEFESCDSRIKHYKLWPQPYVPMSSEVAFLLFVCPRTQVPPPTCRVWGSFLCSQYQELEEQPLSCSHHLTQGRIKNCSAPSVLLWLQTEGKNVGVRGGLGMRLLDLYSYKDTEGYRSIEKCDEIVSFPCSTGMRLVKWCWYKSTVRALCTKCITPPWSVPRGVRSPRTLVVACSGRTALYNSGWCYTASTGPSPLAPPD